MSRFGLISMLLLALFMMACSDDTAPADKGTGKDAMVADKGATADAPVGEAMVLPDQWVGDFPATGLNCGMVSACADRCSLGCPAGATQILCINKCSTDCKAKGCASAQTAYNTLYACVAGKCALDCLGGPTATCKACLFTKCTAEVTACFTQKC